jgi:hypothetical protein
VFSNKFQKGVAKMLTFASQMALLYKYNILVNGLKRHLVSSFGIIYHDSQSVRLDEFKPEAGFNTGFYACMYQHFCDDII